MAEEKSGIPVLALRGAVIFPQVLQSMEVSQDAAARALEAAVEEGKEIFLVAQKDLTSEEPKEEALCRVGTLSVVRQILRLQDGSVRAMVEGRARGRLLELSAHTPYLRAQVEELPPRETGRRSKRLEALTRRARELLEACAAYDPKVAVREKVYMELLLTEKEGALADCIAHISGLDWREKQAILEENAPPRRLEKLCRSLQREAEILSLQAEMENRAQEGLTEAQREQILREQLRVLRQELGEDGGQAEEYRERISRASLPAQAEEKLLKEVARLERQSFGSPEAGVIEHYLDVCLELPWGKKSRERLSLDAARRVLDADHYGLSKVKERVLEALAVRKLAPDGRVQTLCLVGPPGVGKTSVALSIARATGRKLERVSLGGIHDEAEIRGHRKTYVGAMPGRIVNALRHAGTSNPVLVLDEIDKLSASAQGDPAAALLEVLDGEQNAAFRDNFVELPVDLSGVLFITTANTTETIPRPLLDRMEVIELSSYTDEEKLQIAKRYLLPKALKRHGLGKGAVKLTDGAFREIIALYTRESGVRALEQELAAICRKAAMRVAVGDDKPIRITGDQLQEFLGVRRFPRPDGGEEDLVGVASGLAWTQTGGELLEVEANAVPGSGKVELTGNLGEVMKESAHAALTYVRSRAGVLGVEEDFYKNKDIHIHFPEGAIPKDGPSAGVAIAVAMVSALTGIPVRHEVAMTGEITLRGRVLAIGGLKEKTMAALRSGKREILLPWENEKDLEEIDQTVRGALHFIPVRGVDEALVHALTREPGRAPAPD